MQTINRLADDTAETKDWGWSKGASVSFDKENELQHTTDQAMSNYRGVGAVVTKGMNVDQQMEAAGLNWSVESSPIRYGATMEYEESAYRKAIYRSDNGVLLDTVGERWQPHQNKDILQTFNEFCTAGNMEVEHVGCLRGGRTLFAVARTNEAFSLAGDDLVEAKILVTGYHEQGKGHKIDLLTMRQICTNGLTVPVRIGGKVISHVTQWDNEFVTSILEAAKTNFREFQTNSEVLANTPVSNEEAQMWLIKEFGDASKSLEDQPTVVKTCLRLFKGDGRGADLLSSYHTAFGLLNAVTQYTNHHSTVRGGSETHLNSLWLGGKAARQKQFMDKLVSVYVTA